MSGPDRGHPGDRAHHGDLGERERRRLAADVPDGELVDLSVNINPAGPPPGVREAVAAADLTRYPDRTAEDLRHATAAHLGLDPARLVFGNGACELLWTLAGALARRADPRARTALVVEPTFSEYARACEVQGVRVVEWRAEPARDLRVDAGAVLDAARAAAAGSVYLCRPANPGGGLLAWEELRALAEGLGPVPLVLDEAFLSLSTHHAEARAELPPNVVRVRSWTKDFALPGLRLGVLLAAPDLAHRLEAERPPWTTSAPAQAAGHALLAPEVEAWLAERRDALLAGRAELARGLAARGLVGPASRTIFQLVAVGERAPDGAALRRALLARGVVVRDAASFGLPGHVRVAAGTAAMRARLLDALDALDAPG